MNKKTKRLCVLVGLLLVLGAVYVGVRMYNSRQEEQAAREKQEAEQGFLVHEMKEEEIAAFSYQHDGKDYSDKEYVFVKKGELWYYKEDSKFPVNQTVAKTKVEDLAKVYAKRLLEDSSEHFEEYGLKEPALRVSVTDGKETITYRIGNYNESTADYYMNIEGTNEVYTVDGTLWVGFGMELYDMVQMEKFPEIQTDHVTRVHVKTDKQELELLFERTGTSTEAKTGKITYTGTWYTTDETGARVEASAKAASLAKLLTELSYEQEVHYDCPEEELANYGLQEPSAIITIDYTIDQVKQDTIEQVEVQENVNTVQYETEELQKQLTISIGDPTDTFTYTDDYYIKTSGSRAVVTLATSTAEMLLQLDAKDFIGGARVVQ